MSTEIWLVTIKLPKNVNHNPREKVTAPCVASGHCTDQTGEHHTLVAIGEEGLAEVRKKFSHVTRIEKAMNIKEVSL